MIGQASLHVDICCQPASTERESVSLPVHHSPYTTTLCCTPTQALCELLCSCIDDLDLYVSAQQPQQQPTALQAVTSLQALPFVMSPY